MTAIADYLFSNTNPVSMEIVMAKKKMSKMQQVMNFMLDNPHLTQAQVRERFNKRGIRVSSSETSLASSRLKRKRSPGRPKKEGPAGSVLKVPVTEAPIMAQKIKAIRRRNENLRKIIDLLLDEEVGAISIK